MPINYEDERFEEVKTAEKEALTEIEQTYGSMVGEAGKFYQEQKDAVKDFTQQQQQFQQEQTDFAIEQIQQQKDQAKKDYIKEQSGAYTDFKKQSSQHGAAAEQIAGAGMWGSGFSESSQVQMYTAYQNRVATARESFKQAVLTYDNAMKEARLQGSAAMAEIALQGFQQELQLTLEGFQYENQLLQTMLAQKQQTQQIYYGRWQDVLQQLNSEAAMAEQIRQYEESKAFQEKEFEEGKRRFDAELAEQQRQFDEQMALKNSTGKGTTGSGGGGGPTPADGQPVLTDVEPKNPEQVTLNAEKPPIAKKGTAGDFKLYEVEENPVTNRERQIENWMATTLANVNSPSFSLEKLIKGTSFLKTDAERAYALEVAKFLAGTS